MAGRSPLLAALIVCAACGVETLGPASGALRVTVSVVGDGSDSDGFLVVVGRSIQRPLAPGEPVLLDAIAPGEYEVALEGIGPNCTQLGASLLPATVVAGDTAHVAFEVTCDPAGGALQVTVQTSGTDLDPSGYEVLVDSAPMALIDRDGAVLFTVPAGERVVTLGGVNSNCEIVAPASRGLTVPIGGLASAEFEVQCVGGARAGRGHEIAYTIADGTGQSTIHVVNDDGSHSERLFPMTPYLHDTPAWAPDGDRIAFYAEPTDSTLVLTVTDVESGQRKEFDQPRELRSRGFGWSPDGTRLALGDFFLNECPAVRVLHLDGSGEEPLDVGCYSSASFVSFAWSPDGRQLAFVVELLIDIDEITMIGRLGLADLAMPGQSAPPAGCAFQNARNVSWSPDGSRLTVAAGGIVVIGVASETCTRLTEDPSDGSPTWSPDGTRIAFTSTRDGNSEIYVMQADGSALTRITRSSPDEVGPSWRP